MVEPPRYVDVNIFVYWLGKHPKFGETALGWVRKIEGAARKEYVTSSLAVYEALVILAGLSGCSLKDEGFVEEVVGALTRMKGLAIESLKPEDFTCAVDLMNDCKLDFEDALHLAVAVRVGAKEIVSNDNHFDATGLKRIF